MRASEIIELEVFKIWRDQISKFADIRIKYGEIIWMNTNIAKTVVRQVGEFPAFEYQQKLDIEDISQNLIDSFNGKISHKINLEYPYDKDNLYVFITDKQLIKLGFKEKPPIIKFKLNENKRFIIGTFIVIVIAIVGWIIEANSSSTKLRHEPIDSLQNLEKRKTHTLDTTHELNQSDSTNILKTDSLYLDLKD